MNLKNLCQLSLRDLREKKWKSIVVSSRENINMIFALSKRRDKSLLSFTLIVHAFAIASATPGKPAALINAQSHGLGTEAEALLYLHQLEGRYSAACHKQITIRWNYITNVTDETGQASVCTANQSDYTDRSKNYYIIAILLWFFTDRRWHRVLKLPSDDSERNSGKVSELEWVQGWINQEAIPIPGNTRASYNASRRCCKCEITKSWFVILNLSKKCIGDSLPGNLKYELFYRWQNCKGKWNPIILLLEYVATKILTIARLD